jgi:hypothetical protein
MQQSSISLRSFSSRFFGLVGVASLLAVTVVGCVGNSGADERALSQAESRSAGDALGAGLEDAAKTFGPVNSTSADGCIVLSGDTSDADLDSIPADAKLTYNCSATVLGLTGTLTGTQSVIDDQPAAIAWAFTASANLRASLSSLNSASIERDWSGQIVGAQGSPLGPFTLARTLDATTVFTDAAARATTVTEDNDWSVSFAPSLTWTPGGIIVPGSLAATGRWNVDVDGIGAEATLSTPTPLVLSPTCATRITAGTIRGTYEASGALHTIDVTWTGCGAHVVTST